MDKVETDEDGNVVNKFSNKHVAIVVTVIRYLCMLLLYGGMLLVITGLFIMTAETANGRGTIPVVTEAVNATPVGHRPPSPDAAAGAAASAKDTVDKATGMRFFASPLGLAIPAMPK